MARRFFYVSLGILALSIAYHAGVGSVDANVHLEERFAPVLKERNGTSQATVSGWLDRETGCFSFDCNGIAARRRGSAPIGTRYVTWEGSSSIALYAYSNDGTWSYAILNDCNSPDTLNLGPWIPQGPIDVCYDPTSVAGGVQPLASSRASAISSPRPNPFNPSTAIAFTLDDAAAVDLRIYDSSGALVRTLVDQPQTAGAHVVEWNGVDDAGRQVASGTYFYQLRVNGQSVGSKRAVLLK